MAQHYMIALQYLDGSRGHGLMKKFHKKRPLGSVQDEYQFQLRAPEMAFDSVPTELIENIRDPGHPADPEHCKTVYRPKSSVQILLEQHQRLHRVLGRKIQSAPPGAVRRRGNLDEPPKPVKPTRPFIRPSLSQQTSRSVAFTTVDPVKNERDLTESLAVRRSTQSALVGERSAAERRLVDSRQRDIKAEVDARRGRSRRWMTFGGGQKRGAAGLVGAFVDYDTSETSNQPYQMPASTARAVSARLLSSTSRCQIGRNGAVTQSAVLMARGGSGGERKGSDANIDDLKHSITAAAGESNPYEESTERVPLSWDDQCTVSNVVIRSPSGPEPPAQRTTVDRSPSLNESHNASPSPRPALLDRPSRLAVSTSVREVRSGATITSVRFAEEEGRKRVKFGEDDLIYVDDGVDFSGAFSPKAASRVDLKSNLKKSKVDQWLQGDEINYDKMISLLSPRIPFSGDQDAEFHVGKEGGDERGRESAKDGLPSPTRPPLGVPLHKTSAAAGATIKTNSGGAGAEYVKFARKLDPNLHPFQAQKAEAAYNEHLTESRKEFERQETERKATETLLATSDKKVVVKSVTFPRQLQETPRSPRNDMWPVDEELARAGEVADAKAVADGEDIADKLAERMARVLHPPKAAPKDEPTAEPSPDETKTETALQRKIRLVAARLGPEDGDDDDDDEGDEVDVDLDDAQQALLAKLRDED